MEREGWTAADQRAEFSRLALKRVEHKFKMSAIFLLINLQSLLAFGETATSPNYDNSNVVSIIPDFEYKTKVQDFEKETLSSPSWNEPESSPPNRPLVTLGPR